VVYEDERPSFLGETGLTLKERNFSEETARQIDAAVRRIVGDAFGRTVALLTERRQVLDAAAAELLQKETLTAPDLQRLRETLKGYAVPGA
jgi:cell division protease FtsH